MGSMGGPPARPAWAGPAPPPARHSGHRCSASPDGSSTGLNLGFTPLTLEVGPCQVEPDHWKSRPAGPSTGSWARPSLGVRV